MILMNQNYFNTLSEFESGSLLGDGLCLEYTRDTPMFKQQIFTAMENYAGYEPFTKNIRDSFVHYKEALMKLREAQKKLILAFKGHPVSGSKQEANLSSRCLFSNAASKLGDLSKTLNMLSNVLESSNKIHEEFSDAISQKIIPVFKSLTERSSMSREKEILKELNSSSTKYEKILLKTLNSRKSLSNEEMQKALIARSNYELNRFDLVRKVNNFDVSQKIELTAVACDLYEKIRLCYKDLYLKATSHGAIMEEKKKHLSELAVEQNLKSSLWDRVRARLQGELVGAMPPPGSPAGAFNPDYLFMVRTNRSNGSNYLLSAALTTEVLTAGTRRANFEDLKHARDEGIYKQGYLTVQKGTVMRRKVRSWYRLYGTKMYVVEVDCKDYVSLATTSIPVTITSTIIADLLEATVTIQIGGDPYRFTIHLPPKMGKDVSGKFDFQADNEEELMHWIWAVRRCATGKLYELQDMAQQAHWTETGSVGSRKNSITSSSKDSTDPEVGEKIADMVKSVGDPTNEGSLYRRFVDRNDEKNDVCCECSNPEVMWVSINIGVTLCEDCAAAHRQLSWEVSKLKSIFLDDFYDWQVDLLVNGLGNRRNLEIWEASIPQGWKKPTRHSPLEDKKQWVRSKYQWHAFVADSENTCSTQQLVKGINEAVWGDKGVPEITWWMAHRADINSSFTFEEQDEWIDDTKQCMRPNTTCPLVSAVIRRDSKTVAYILLNGAHIHLEANSENKSKGASIGGQSDGVDNGTTFTDSTTNIGKGKEEQGNDNSEMRQIFLQEMQALTLAAVEDGIDNKARKVVTIIENFIEGKY